MSVAEAKPIVERIADELMDRLGILTAGWSAQSSVKEVIRPKRLEGYTPKHLQVVVTQGDNDEQPDMSHPGNPPAVARQQVFNIRCHVMPSEKDPTAVDYYVNTMAADVRKAICRPQATWHTFGGIAIDAEWQAHETIESERFDGVNVPLAVLYRTDENDPYTARA